MKKKSIIIAIIAGAVLISIGLVLVFGNIFLKDPRVIILSAIARTYSEVKTPDIKIDEVFGELINNKFRQDISFGINKLNSQLLNDMDPRLLSALEMVTLKNITRRDTRAKKFKNNLSIQFAVTPLAELELYGDPEIMAATSAQIINYYITADPRKVAQEWDNSILGRYFGSIDGLILEEPFYEYYMRLLFPGPKTVQKRETPGYVKNIGILDKGTEYAYEGKDTREYQGVNKEYDVYTVSVTAEALNEYLRLVFPLEVEPFPDDLFGDYLNEWLKNAEGLQFREGITIWVYVDKGRAAGIRIQTGANFLQDEWRLNGAFFFLGEKALLDEVNIWLSFFNGVDLYEFCGTHFSNVSDPQHFISRGNFELTGIKTLALDWDINWDKKNTSRDSFSLTFAGKMPGTAEIRLNANGLMDIRANNVDINLRNIGLAVNVPFLYSGGPIADVSLNARYILRAESENIGLEDHKQIPITKINEFDVLLMYGNIMNDTQLGTLLSEIIS